MIRRLAHHVLLLAVTALCSATAPVDAAGPRIGFLSPATRRGFCVHLEGFRQGLREHGYVEGTNITIEYRFANDHFDRLPGLAQELIGLPVDVLVSFVTLATIAARDNTKTIPIVMVGVSDPVASGLVTSLSRPGGNVTGTSGMSSEVAGKQLQLLKEAISTGRRAAVLWNPANRVFQMQLIQETEAAARPLDIELQMFEARELGVHREGVCSNLEGPFFGAERTRGPDVVCARGSNCGASGKGTFAFRERASFFTEAGGLS